MVDCSVVFWTQILSKGISMKNRIPYSIRLAVAGLTFLAFLATTRAQQAPPKPAGSAARTAKAKPTPAAKKPAASAARAQAANAASSATPANASDKVVLKVGDQQITEADLDFLISKLNPQAQQALAKQGRRPLGEQYAMMLLLSQHAKSHHAENAPDFLRQVELFRLQTLAQSEYQAIADQAVLTPEEVKQYYATHNSEFEEAEVRQVVIRKKAADATDDIPGLKEADAKARAEEIRKALAAGGDVNKVVQEYAKPNTVIIEAEPRAIRHGQLLAALDKAAFQLKDGEVSDTIETPQALVFVQKVGLRKPELQEVIKEIEDTLRQEKVQATLEELRSKTTMWMDDAYFAGPPVAPASAVPAPEANPSPE
jgi:peptidyl-prolyl cis-trans isomerase C